MPARRSGERLALSALIVLVTLLAYWPVRGYEFLRYDDAGYITDNPRVGNGLTLAGIRWAFTTDTMANWHPLTWLSYMTDASLFGLDAGGFHAVNVALHALGAGLLFLALDAATGARWRSGVVAALFALHPLHVESVAWVAERKDVLSGVFWMLTILAYVRYARVPTRARYGAVVFAFALGLMAKPMLVTLPFVLLLLDFWPLDRLGRDPTGDAPTAVGGSWRAGGRLVWEKSPLIALAAVASVVALLVQQHGGAVHSGAELPIADRLANAALAYVGYLRKTFWPTDLACFYPYHRPFGAGRVATAVLVLALVSLVAWRSARRRPYLLVGWLWFLGTLVPVIGLVQVGPQSMADRYTYLPLIGVFIATVWAVTDAARHWRLPRALPALAAGSALAACVVLTRAQLTYWHDGVALFEHALAVTRGNYIAHYQLGAELAVRGRRDEAVAHYREAVRMAPVYTEAHASLAGALLEAGQLDEAAEHAAAVMALRPNDVQAATYLGAARWRQGRVDEAFAAFAEASRLAPDSAESHNNLALALAARGRIAEALAHYAEALRLAPDYADAHFNLATALAAADGLDQAERHFAEFLRLRPGDAEGQAALADVHARRGRTPETLRIGPGGR